MSDCSSSSDDEDLPHLVSRMAVGASGAPSVVDDEEMEGEELYVDSLQPARDLFSDKTFRTPEECIAHCRNVHGLDLGLLKRRHAMDTFSYIRFVNYLRTERPSPGFVMSLGSDAKWADERFLRPVLEDDPMLMYNFEDEGVGGIGDGLGEGDDDENGFEIDISRDLNDEIENPRSGGGGGYHIPSVPIAPTGAECTPLGGSIMVVDACRSAGDGEESSDAALQEQIRQLQLQLAEKEYQLGLCSADMQKMRSAAQALFASSSQIDDRPAATPSLQTVSQQKTLEEDHSYFQSYAHYSIHHEMLSDRVRTESYRDALLANAASAVAGRRVLDIGCGTGILSMFAARAGAARVVGIDCSDILYSAMDIVRENGLADRITLVKGRLEETQLPGSTGQKFDLIVSEWMGYFLLFEGMLDSVLAARDRYLAPGGTLLPNRVNLSLVALSDPARYDSLIGFWADVYGFKMSCMRAPILAEANVEVVPSSAVVSPPATVLNLDLNTCSVTDTEFDAAFTLTVDRSCELTAVAGYFDTFFDLAVPVSFSTGPAATPTHWKQTVFYLPHKLAVSAGQVLNCRIVCKRMTSDTRALKVALTLDDLVLRYTVD